MGILTRVRDRLLDGTVALSFDRSGYRRHARAFDPADLQVDLGGQVALVTGANSGIGFETAVGLARLGARVWMLCRDPARGLAAQDALRAATGRADAVLACVDVSSARSVRAFVEGFDAPRVDVLVHNAGVLPSARQLTDDGVELTWATNVAGPYLLTQLLRPRLIARAEKLGPSRVIFVSSGGMYLQKLAFDELDDAPDAAFDGVRTYARTKRAQVVLSELLAERFAPGLVDVNAMHPGWADTPSVRTSIPKFHAVTRAILRSPSEGADTVVWLAAARRLRGTSGRFFFDRAEKQTHVAPWTRESADARERLWQWCARRSSISPEELRATGA